ncbi:MAG: sulfite exporter TauE/SafE family protein [Reyranella sp.]|uniref:sulfite exporter TauE/SafE family protein n=1 Tax=Reyranella sp. TaxID=1929291 RepID=UPI002730BC9F|nr:sulfite exporter TauE/SafE family protein [Reyranella sp.]MDP1966621.1 sulfite exporter TauE/SafE family protein [Reyranella sp.]MDP2376503.1 sulfite exporter TauE/SafE family protein [Reyranella sp.]
MIYALVLIVGFAAGTVSGIVGTGATIILLPILVLAFGPREAVPIMAVVALMSNFAKITSWWREIDWRACAAYALGGIPAAALGARTLLVLPEKIVDVALGLFFLAMIPARRWLAARNFKFGFWHLAIAGAVIGFLTGIVVSTGPLSVPAFAAYGLVKGAFIATEAAGSLALYISKAVIFREFGALPVDIVLKGLISGSSVMAGTYTARLIVDRLSVTTFQRLLDVVMALSGLALLWAAIR